MSRRSKLTSGSGRLGYGAITGGWVRVVGTGTVRAANGKAWGSFVGALDGLAVLRICSEVASKSARARNPDSSLSSCGRSRATSKRVAQRANTHEVDPCVGRLNVCVTLYLSIFVTSVRFGVARVWRARAHAPRAQAHHCLRPQSNAAAGA